MFHQLSLEAAEANASTLKGIGPDVTPLEMARLSRVFRYDVAAFMDFMMLESTDLDDALLFTHDEITQVGSLPVYLSIYLSTLPYSNFT